MEVRQSNLPWPTHVWKTVIQPITHMAQKTERGTTVLKPQALTNIKVYILQQQRKCFFKDISAYNSTETICYHV
jgi:hypothetical protein